MSRKNSGLVCSGHEGNSRFHHTGETVPESGIYEVMHSEHRLPHEVTLLRGQSFPRCSKCGEKVSFVAMRLEPDLCQHNIVLYELPEILVEKKARKFAA